MAASNVSNILFGIEIEFFVEEPRVGLRIDLDESETRAQLGLWLGRTTGLPIACQCLHGMDDEDVPCEVCNGAHSGELFDGGRSMTGLLSDTDINANHDPRYRFFYLQVEGIFDPEWRADVQRHAMEISSPVFRPDELTAGLPRMARLFSSLAHYEHQVVATESCGLHIHVGPESGMTLLYAKKLVTLVILLEKALLRRLLPESRLESKWSQPITDESLLRLRMNTIKELSREDTLPPCPEMDIWVAFTDDDIRPASWNNEDPADLYLLLQVFWRVPNLYQASSFVRRHGGKLGMTLELRTAPGESWEGNSHSTAEFRYPQMSFNLEYIRNWTAIACRIAEIADFTSAAYSTKLRALLVALNADRTEDTLWQDLLLALDLGEQIPEWLGQMALYHVGEDMQESPEA